MDFEGLRETWAWISMRDGPFFWRRRCASSREAASQLWSRGARCMRKGPSARVAARSRRTPRDRLARSLSVRAAVMAVMIPAADSVWWGCVMAHGAACVLRAAQRRRRTHTTSKQRRQRRAARAANESAAHAPGSTLEDVSPVRRYPGRTYCICWQQMWQHQIATCADDY